MANSVNDVNTVYLSDMKRVYLLAFDHFTTDPSEVASTLDINIRYARELLGLLVKERLLTEDDSSGEQIWQVIDPGTYDSAGREQAVARIDQWLAEHGATSTGVKADKPKPTTRTRQTATSNSGAFDKDGAAILCMCGCAEQVSGKSKYRPGHDARHAGRVARLLAQDVLDGSYKTLAAAVKVDPMEGIDSPKLRAKVRAIAEARIAKSKKAGAK